MNRPLIIGQAPARGNDDLPPFSGKSGARLARLAGVGTNGDDLPAHFDLINVIETWPGKLGKRGDAFPMAEARTRAYAIKEALKFRPRSDILLMGRKVKRAMGLRNETPYLEWMELWGHRVLVFPHPSGLNMFWNDVENNQAARRVLREVISRARAA